MIAASVIVNGDERDIGFDELHRRIKAMSPPLIAEDRAEAIGDRLTYMLSDTLQQGCMVAYMDKDGVEVMRLTAISDMAATIDENGTTTELPIGSFRSRVTRLEPMPITRPQASA
jgi:hypothetical protein